MKFLHTADWHIGRTVGGRSRESEHHAALNQVFSYAKQGSIDCLLVAGDLFDTSTPSPESERLLYDFFSEMYGLGVPAVVVAGNHDHPRRFDALAPILRTLSFHLRGQPVGPSEGGIVQLPSRDGKERASVAALPWVHEREVIPYAQLGQQPGVALAQYANQLQMAMDILSRALPLDTVNILMAHALVDGALVGRGGGERELHMAMGIYGIQPQVIPTAAQYVALGHVHKPQTLRSSPPACYSGSLLQLDFGEQNQDKYVNLVEVHPGTPAQVTQLPVTAGRRLVDLGAPSRGVGLAELATLGSELGDAWLRVYADVSSPVADLPAKVRGELPNAVRIERAGSNAENDGPEEPPLSGLPPEELFARFYQSPLGRRQQPSPATLELFRRLLEEETHATAQA